MQRTALIGFFSCFLYACAADDATCPELKELIGLDGGQEMLRAVDRAVITRCPEIVPDIQCWTKPDDTYCRFGLHYGPDIGGVNDGICTAMGATDIPLPCVTGTNKPTPLPAEEAKEMRRAKAVEIDALRADDEAKKAAIEDYKARVAAEVVLPIRKPTAEDDYHIGVVSRP
jgi:hypothetical protein